MALLETKKRDWGRVAKVPDELGRYRCSKCKETNCLPEKMELLNL